MVRLAAMFLAFLSVSAVKQRLKLVARVLQSLANMADTAHVKVGEKMAPTTAVACIANIVCKFAPTVGSICTGS